MHLQVVAVGKIKEDYLKRAIEDYKKRISKYAKIKISEVAEEDISLRVPEEVKAREAQKLIKSLPERESWQIIALDREGEELSSEQLAQKIESLMISGKSNVAFLIGGALGLDDSITQRADFRLSLSRMTFPHQLARLVILEQIYRAFKIIKGEPYHY